MRRRWWAPAAALVLVAGVAGAVALASADHPTAAAAAPSTPTDTVRRGPLAAMVSGAGTLTYRARPDGSPYVAVNRAAGVYTELPAAGDHVGCGDVLYRVDDRPVLLLCGAVPAYRALHAGLRGPDAAQLNRTLRRLGLDRAAHVRLARGQRRFTPATARALRVLQRRRGVRATGALAAGDAVFLPEAVRIAKVTGRLGAAASPGAPVLWATSGALHVRVDLDAAHQGEVRRGDRVQVTLPGSMPARGRVAGFGRIAQAPQGAPAASATIPTFIDLDNPAEARGLDQAPVDVDITTRGVPDALSVPVTALVGKAGGGFAVEVVGPGGRRDLVAVRLGLFDTGGGRVQVEGGLRAGDAVAVPSL